MKKRNNRFNIALISACITGLLSACSTNVADAEPRPAILSGANANNTQALSQAMSLALNGKKVSLVSNAFLKDSQHTLEKRAMSGINSNNADMKNPPTCPYLIQVALKCSLDVFYFQVPCLLQVLLSASPVSVTQMQCQQMASSIGNKNTVKVITSRFAGSTQDLKTRLKANSFYHIFDEGSSMVFATQTVNNIPLVIK